MHNNTTTWEKTIKTKGITKIVKQQTAKATTINASNIHKTYNT